MLDYHLNEIPYYFKMFLIIVFYKTNCFKNFGLIKIEVQYF